MGRKPDVSEDENSKIIKNISLGIISPEILKMLQRDHQTIKKYTEDSSAQRKR